MYRRISSRVEIELKFRKKKKLLLSLEYKIYVTGLDFRDDCSMPTREDTDTSWLGDNHTRLGVEAVGSRRFLLALIKS